jgi:hypothetical protein
MFGLLLCVAVAVRGGTGVSSSDAVIDDDAVTGSGTVSVGVVVRQDRLAVPLEGDAVACERVLDGVAGDSVAVPNDGEVVAVCVPCDPVSEKLGVAPEPERVRALLVAVLPDGVPLIVKDTVGGAERVGVGTVRVPCDGEADSVRDRPDGVRLTVDVGGGISVAVAVAVGRLADAVGDRVARLLLCVAREGDSDLDAPE